LFVFLQTIEALFGEGLNKNQGCAALVFSANNLTVKKMLFLRQKKGRNSKRPAFF